jgi:hypothetical protein
VRAVDAAADGIQRTVLVAVDGSGAFELPSDPGRAYFLFLEPPADRSQPRFNLTSARAPLTGNATFTQSLPDRLSQTGTILNEDGKTKVGGALVQVFCWGAPPGCVDRQVQDISSTLPIDQTISAADGSYKLSVPDPGQ